MEKRKESFDALNISEMMFDDLHHHNGHNSSHHPSSGTEADLSIFDELLYGNNGQNGQRRTLRFDSLLNDSLFSDSNEQRDDDDDADVDLSAYATLAQSLQTNKPSKGGSPMKDSSRLVTFLLFSVFFFSFLVAFHPFILLFSHCFREFLTSLVFLCVFFLVTSFIRKSNLNRTI
jgi:hypothetical protein